MSHFQTQQKGKATANSGGFVLIFTVLMVTILMVITSSLFSFVISQTKNIRDEQESAKALYAADTGIECVRFYQKNFNAFDTTNSEQTIDCGVGTMTAGIPSPGSECVNHNYTPSTPFTLTLSNGACTHVYVNVVARNVFYGGAPHQICDVYVVSNGRNTCSGGANVIERSRWENL